MPNYTTSYSTKNKPRYRKNLGNQLPGGRRRQQRRKNAQYLRRSQGFGGRRRSGHGYGGNDRRPYAIIVVGCAFLLFVASIVWYANRSVEIELNGETTKVRIHSDIERIISDQELDLKPGNLLAVDDEVIEKGGGTAYTVSLKGKKLSKKQIASVEIEGGEKLTIEDGEDIYEPHDVKATAIDPAITVEGSGALSYVETWGEAGRSEVWTGDLTGKTVDKGMVKQPVDAHVVRTAITPDVKGKKFVALTFDEGPSDQTREILRILSEKDARATFFVSGDKVAAQATSVRAIAASGNELGTNAYEDIDLTELSGEDLRAQITKSFDAVEQASGKRPVLLRPPFGAFSDENWAAAMDLVSGVVTWNVDSGDWLLQGADAVVNTVIGSIGNGDVILLTDNDATAAQTVEALPVLIDRLHEEGYELVTLSELIAADKDLKDVVDLTRAGLPKDAVLPVIEDGAESSDEEG